MENLSIRILVSSSYYWKNNRYPLNIAVKYGDFSTVFLEKHLGTYFSVGIPFILQGPIS